MRIVYVCMSKYGDCRVDSLKVSLGCSESHSIKKSQEGLCTGVEEWQSLG